MTNAPAMMGTPIWTVLAPVAGLGFAGLAMALPGEGLALWLILPAVPILFGAVHPAGNHRALRQAAL